MKAKLSLPRHRVGTRCGAVLLLAALSLAAAHAQSFRVEPVSIAAGGGTSTGGQFGVVGTAGQTQSGRAMGGNYIVDTGFAALITALQTPGAPYLQLTRAGNTVTLAWDATVPGFVLENVDSLSGTPSWLVVGLTPVLNNSTNSVTLTLTPGAQFYRLRKP